jgi:hypothetical protein
MCSAENFLIGCRKTKKLDGNIFIDETHFQLDGYVNTQNCWIWVTENPQVIHEKPLHTQRGTVWYRFRTGGSIWPYFFENEPRNAVTMNGVRYRNVVMEFLWPQLDGMDMEDM